MRLKTATGTTATDDPKLLPPPPTNTTAQLTETKPTQGEAFELNAGQARAKDLSSAAAKAEVTPKMPQLMTDTSSSTKLFGHKVSTDPDTGEKYMYFWKTASPFSQWFPADFEFRGHHFVTSEQWMMAMKALVFGDRETLGKILVELDPKKQKELGRQVKNFDADKWSALAFGAVYLGNALKFGGELKPRLLETRGHTLVEASPHDTIWGIGLAEESPDSGAKKTWKGTNRLGQVLTELREDLESGKADARIKAFIDQLGIGSW